MKLFKTFDSIIFLNNIEEKAQTIPEEPMMGYKY
jgi:hypothetical protein